MPITASNKEYHYCNAGLIDSIKNQPTIDSSGLSGLLDKLGVKAQMPVSNYNSVTLIGRDMGEFVFLQNDSGFSLLYSNPDRIPMDGPYNRVCDLFEGNRCNPSLLVADMAWTDIIDYAYEIANKRAADKAEVFYRFSQS